MQGDDENNEGSEFPLTPIQGTYIIGLTNAIASAIPFLYVKKVGRKPVFVVG